VFAEVVGLSVWCVQSSQYVLNVRRLARLWLARQARGGVYTVLFAEVVGLCVTLSFFVFLLLLPTANRATVVLRLCNCPM